MKSKQAGTWLQLDLFRPSATCSSSTPYCGIPNYIILLTDLEDFCYFLWIAWVCLRDNNTRICTKKGLWKAGKRVQVRGSSKPSICFLLRSRVFLCISHMRVLWKKSLATVKSGCYTDVWELPHLATTNAKSLFSAIFLFFCWCYRGVLSTCWMSGPVTRTRHPSHLLGCWMIAALQG